MFILITLFFKNSFHIISTMSRKLKNTIEEYTTRVGQQAVVLCCTPGRAPGTSSSLYKVFGSQPLENVVGAYMIH